jgi:hypothetical protein
MLSYEELLPESGVDYFVVEMPEDKVPYVALINEGQWVASGKYLQWQAFVPGILRLLLHTYCNWRGRHVKSLCFHK